MHITKWIAALEMYIPGSVDTITIASVICADQYTARAKAEELIENIFNERFIRDICPGRGFDPLRYSMEAMYNGTTPMIWYDYNNKWSYKHGPVFVGKHYNVECHLEEDYNVIEYRGFKISNFMGKWYISCTHSSQVIGFIDHKDSLKEILDDACKVIEEAYVSEAPVIPAVVLTDV